MPVTFNDQPNQRTVYVDPAFRYDSSTRLLGRELQHQNNVEFYGGQLSRSKNKSPRTVTPLSEYKRAFSRSGSPDNEVNILPVNVAEVDQACYDTTTGTNV